MYTPTQMQQNKELTDFYEFLTVWWLSSKSLSIKTISDSHLVHFALMGRNKYKALSFFKVPQRMNLKCEQSFQLSFVHRLVITWPVDNSEPNAAEESFGTHKSVGILAMLLFLAIDLS